MYNKGANPHFSHDITEHTETGSCEKMTTQSIFLPQKSKHNAVFGVAYMYIIQRKSKRLLEKSTHLPVNMGVSLPFEELVLEDF